MSTRIPKAQLDSTLTALGNTVTGSGSIVLGTSPTLTTPALGTPSAVVLTNGTGLPIAGLTGLGTGVATLLAAASTGTAALVGSTSPTLVTPTLGVATATTINKVTVTAPATSATLTLAQGSTLATSGAFSITLTATAATTVTLPTSGTLATTTATLTGDATGNLGAVVVGKINGVSLAGLATGILKNTTTTGVPSIAVAADFPTLNQSTTGNAATASNATAVGGITVTGTPAIGNVLTATSTTAAGWAAPAGGTVGTTEDTAGFTYPTSRPNLRATISPTSGLLMLYGFTAGMSRTITKLGVSVGGTAAAGVTHFQMGIYSVNTSTGALTLVANTADQTTGLTGAYTPYQVALASSYGIVAGNRYMVGVTISATTMPVLNAAAGSDDYGNNNYAAGLQQRLVGTVAAQTTLPSTLADSAISANGNSAHVLLVL